MKIAITGASGYIGKNVLKQIAHWPSKIVAVTRGIKSIENPSSGVEIVEWDIAQSPRYCFERLGSPDVLIHLAWGGLPNYGSNEHYEVEFPKHYEFIKEMVISGVKHLLVAGTCFEYGIKEGELCETDEVNPSNPYAYAKDTLRRKLEDLQVTIGYQLTWMRIFYVYGDGAPDYSLYGQLRNAIIAGQDVFNMSMGEQVRDYMKIDELAYCITKLAHNNRGAGIVNVCSGRPITILSLVKKILKENDWRIELNPGYYEYSKYEPMCFWGNASKLRCLLNER